MVEYIKSLGDYMKKLVLMSVATSLLLLTGCGSKEDASEAGEQIVNSIENTGAEAAAEGAKESAEAAKDGADDAKESAKESADDAEDGAKTAKDDTKDAAEDAAEEATQAPEKAEAASGKEAEAEAKILSSEDEVKRARLYANITEARAKISADRAALAKLELEYAELRNK